MTQLRAYLEAAPRTLPSPDSYFNGKEMARLAELARIADAAGYDDLRDEFVAVVQPVLEDWLTYSGSTDTKFFYRDDTWDTVIAYESSFFSDSLLNDHHFHYGYFLMTAAALAQFDPAWSADGQWGGMVKLMIKDVANGDRSDTSFPFLRFFAPFAGHSWANGPANAGDGNNQESSSEAINFANGLIHWGEVTNNDSLRDLGIFLYTTETTAVHQYWFDVDGAVIPHDPATSGRSYVWKNNGMIWGGKAVAVTYFGAAAACVTGINILPVTAGSLYLGRYPDHVQTIYDQTAAAYDAFTCWAPPAGAGQPPPTGGDNWGPIFWQYLSLTNPISATAMFTDSVPWINNPASGTSPAQVYYWLHNMQELGETEIDVSADHALHAVFTTTNEDGSVEYTYVAHNYDDEEELVEFSDGTVLRVPAGETVYWSQVGEYQWWLPWANKR
jgi:endoglucanase Acf2